MGAMENKGLNVFNTAYVLADKKTASDGDFERVEGVVRKWHGCRTCMIFTVIRTRIVI